MAIRVDQLFATAVYRGDAALVREMLSYKAMPSASNEYGMTPLHWAAEQGHVDVARALIDAGASTRAANERGETPLHVAVREGDAAMCTVLLAEGAAPDAQDRLGVTPAQLVGELPADEAGEVAGAFRGANRAGGNPARTPVAHVMAPSRDPSRVGATGPGLVVHATGDAQVVAFGTDPEDVASLREVAMERGADGRWRVVRADACVQ